MSPLLLLRQPFFRFSLLRALFLLCSAVPSPSACLPPALSPLFALPLAPLAPPLFRKRRLAQVLLRFLGGHENSTFFTSSWMRVKVIPSYSPPLQMFNSIPPTTFFPSRATDLLWQLPPSPFRLHAIALVRSGLPCDEISQMAISAASIMSPSGSEAIETQPRSPSGTRRRLVNGVGCSSVVAKLRTSGCGALKQRVRLNSVLDAS
eukprot:96412-Pleurochrysis_carterae.AAC.2